VNRCDWRGRVGGGVKVKKIGGEDENIQVYNVSFGGKLSEG